MSLYLSPAFGVAGQFFDNNGVLLVGGKLYTYAAGTTTPKVSYTTIVGDQAHTNPIILDSAARIPNGGVIWLDFAPYKFVLETSDNVLIATWDNISGIGAAVTSTDNFTGDGVLTNFTLSNAPFSKNAILVYVNGVYQQRNTFTLSGATLIFSEAPPRLTTIEVLFS
jgi:hypothetical protein